MLKVRGLLGRGGAEGVVVCDLSQGDGSEKGGASRREANGAVCWLVCVC